MENEKPEKPTGKRLLISITAGVAAMALFLVSYYFLQSKREKVFYEGAGRYTAVMASGSGVSSEFGGMEIVLQPNGSCTVILGDKEKNGQWKRAGDRVEIIVGRQKLSGTLIGDTLEIMSDQSPTRISLLNTESMKTAALPAGSWKLSSVTDGFSAYTGEMLRKLGYEGSYIEIGENGKGTAKLLTQESEITVTGEFINFRGMLLPFSFSENQLSIMYSEGVTLSFEK